MRGNLWGSVWCTHAALPHLRASQGRIVAVASLAGLVIAVKGSEFSLFKNKQEVEDFARDAGAKLMKNLSKSVTHMVCRSPAETHGLRLSPMARPPFLTVAE